jgi:hypothetical protein
MTAIAPFPFGQPAVILRPTGPANRYGEQTYAEHHIIEGCGLAPRYSSEVHDNRSSVIIGFSLFGPPGSDILAKDRVRWVDGNTYRVEGEAAQWDNPLTGWVAGFEAALERIT